ncbi:MAG: rod shape-determining protein MreC [Bacteroidetes bacterium]|nr:rod shape-determining protein MreC [Bacteroidota bacterium]
MYKLIKIITTYKDYFIFAGLIIISLSLIYKNTNNEVGGFRTLAAVTFGSLSSVFSWITDMQVLRIENKELINMNINFFAEVTQMHKAISENNDLRTMLDMGKNYRYSLIVCDVTNKHSVQLRNYIVLNKGLKDSIDVGMPVISLKGLVGSVLRCSENYAIVETINNKNVKIPALLSESKLNGIVTWNDDENLYMEYIMNTAEIKVGEQVYTSLLNSKYPEDILIGKVIDIVDEPGSFFYKIIIEPANAFFDYRQVLVIHYIKDKEELDLIKELDNRLIELNKKK